EAMVLADRIVIMANGEIQQVGTPQELYSRPSNPFVADFIGQNNLMRGTVVNDGGRPGLRLHSDIIIPLSPQRVTITHGREADLSIRPEHLTISVDEPSRPDVVPARVSE